MAYPSKASSGGYNKLFKYINKDNHRQHKINTERSALD